MYFLEIQMEGLPSHVGPFPTRLAAQLWMAKWGKHDGSWSVIPMSHPDDV